MNKENDRKQFENISNILKRVVGNLDIEACKDNTAPGEIVELWSSLIGEPFANHTRPARIRKGILTVWVDSSAMLQELKNYGKQALLETIREKWPKIKDIKFKAGIV